MMVGRFVSSGFYAGNLKSERATREKKKRLSIGVSCPFDYEYWFPPKGLVTNLHLSVC